ncbi:hypothetical protein [Enterovirga aerilata]|uniref:Uncharacterized protein n=1 Tax=Enterovirga aerilata TaxID=2730920 RepID=A0A849IM41_9HYPH|nr:hypothetical protein [Enterovirga sp. DB1703]NNM75013.1 hypothetical protein [Enterovirga sp. DB1703]
MSAPAAISGTFADFRTVKGRKVAQLVIEIPIEQADAALHALGGVPRPDDPKWVAVARLNSGLSKATDSDPEVAPKRSFASLPPAQQAALQCRREAFWRFLREEYNQPSVQDEESAAAVVRSICKVTSRSEIATGSTAAAAWFRVNEHFGFWMKEPVL